MNRPPTPGFKAILLSEAVFRDLQSVQRNTTYRHNDSEQKLHCTLDLKDIATAVLQRALADPALVELAMQDVLRSLIMHLQPHFTESKNVTNNDAQ
jgi:hypothetical protein